MLPTVEIHKISHQDKYFPNENIKSALLGIKQWFLEQQSYDMLHRAGGHVSVQQCFFESILTDFMHSCVVSCTVHFCMQPRRTPVVLCCLHMLFFMPPTPTRAYLKLEYLTDVTGVYSLQEFIRFLLLSAARVLRPHLLPHFPCFGLFFDELSSMLVP